MVVSAFGKPRPFAFGYFAYLGGKTPPPNYGETRGGVFVLFGLYVDYFARSFGLGLLPRYFITLFVPPRPFRYKVQPQKAVTSFAVSVYIKV